MKPMNTPILFEVFVPMAELRVEVTRFHDRKRTMVLCRHSDASEVDSFTSVDRHDASDWFAQDFQSAMTMPSCKPIGGDL